MALAGKQEKTSNNWSQENAAMMTAAECMLRDLGNKALKSINEIRSKWSRFFIEES